MDISERDEIERELAPVLQDPAFKRKRDHMVPDIPEHRQRRGRFDPRDVKQSHRIDRRSPRRGDYVGRARSNSASYRVRHWAGLPVESDERHLQQCARRSGVYARLSGAGDRSIAE